MIPTAGRLVSIGDSTEIESEADQPSLTYSIDFSALRISGTVDGLNAVKQAIYMILQTKRFAHVIFSWDYGMETDRLIGKNKAVVQSEIKRVITEALTVDERITNVTNFKITFIDKRSATVEFTVISVFGDISISEEVTV